MRPVISFVGRPNAGKTTYLVKLIGELKRRGYRVGTIKHHHKGDFDIDIPGKDTWHHAQAGADVVCIASPGKMAMIRKLEEEKTIAEIASQMEDMDIIITEGYKREHYPKVEVFRKGICSTPLTEQEELLAVVGDVKIYEEVPLFELNDPAPFADFLEVWLKKLA